MILLQIADDKRMAKRIHLLQSSGRLNNYDIAQHLGISLDEVIRLIKTYPKRVSNEEGRELLLNDKVLRR